MDSLSQLHKNKLLGYVHSGNLGEIKLFETENGIIPWHLLRYDIVGDTALHVAARLGHAVLLEHILSGAGESVVEAKNRDCKTALHEAAQFGCYECAELLLR